MEKGSDITIKMRMYLDNDKLLAVEPSIITCKIENYYILKQCIELSMEIVKIKYDTLLYDAIINDKKFVGEEYVITLNSDMGFSPVQEAIEELFKTIIERKKSTI